jgi:hypothetical protein
MSLENKTHAKNVPASKGLAIFSHRKTFLSYMDCVVVRRTMKVDNI